MKYLANSNLDKYFMRPNSFSKFSEKNILKYAVASNLYMNSLMNVYKNLKSIPNEYVGAITICFEDSIKESEVVLAEENIYKNLNLLIDDLDVQNLRYDDMPLLFIRVRNINQFRNFTEKLTIKQANLLSGFVLPKFDTSNAREYLNTVIEVSHKFDKQFYVMPILESEEIIYKEKRGIAFKELQMILNRYKNIILNIRVGGTDFSSNFSLRRGCKTSIYEVKVISDCLCDIINFFRRKEEDFIISGPVWEYFSEDIDSAEIKGLIKEINLDIENGFVGKTSIHPYQSKYISSSLVVSYDEYIDAKNILGVQECGGVFKGENGNKMNEVSPHIYWAKKIIERAYVFGVLKKGLIHSDLY